MEKIKAQIEDEGYIVIKNFLNKSDSEKFETELGALKEKHYNQENIMEHSVYPSDKTETRESHAMMIAQGESELPKVDHTGFEQITKFLDWHNEALETLTGKKVATSARALLNWQYYYCSSKPVGEHFDGEYIRADRQDSVEFKLLEGILPRYVCVLTIKNENNGKGVELVDKHNDKIIAPAIEDGDLIFFDNVQMRHRVPTLEKPRMSVGLRNFDHIPYHFVRNEKDCYPNHDYSKIPEGFISESVDCHKRFKDFLAIEWPEIRKDYGSYV